MSHDAIKITGLRVQTHIGVTDEEQAESQTVVVDLSLHADLTKAGISDDLADTIDYDAVINGVTELVRSSKPRLLEHLAEEIVNLISRFRLVDRVTVELRKERLPGPSADVEAVTVRIERVFT